MTLLPSFQPGLNARIVGATGVLHGDGLAVKDAAVLALASDQGAKVLVFDLA